MPRLAVALVWLYQGLWCKLLGRCPGHRAIVQAVPGLAGGAGTAVLLGLGMIETGLAVWVLSGWRPRWAAAAQTLLLVGMNGGGLLWGHGHIADAGAMITQNLAFLTLAWLVAGRAARPSDDGVTTPWSRGRLDGRPGPPQLLFSRMHEDWRVEAEVFRPGGRIFCIASSGDTAVALARRGFQVTAVDINPAQIEYAKARAAGEAPGGPGVVDRQQAMARRLLPWLGLGKRDLREFLLLGDPAEQTAFWHRRLDNFRLRWLLRIGLHKALLRLGHDRSFVSFVPPRFDLVILGRLERTWANHPNRENPYVWRLLLGEDPPAKEPDAKDLKATVEAELLCADAAEFLASGLSGRFDGFTLSNVLDAAPPAYGERLLAAVRHAAAPGAVMVLRSFAEPRDAQQAAWAARDRSPLWGSIEVTGID